MNSKFTTDLAAYLLVSHGSRDRNHQIAVTNLATAIARQLATNQPSKQLARSSRQSAVLTKFQAPIVATAQLELAEITLHRRIERLATEIAKIGVKRLYVLPLFLLPGIHVKEDIPAEIAMAREILGDRIEIELLPYLGSNLSLIELIETQFATIPSSERILISHGSRRQGGNRPCETIAWQLNANVAYCWLEPSLSATVAKIAARGTKRIAVVPYFLFAGKILNSIAAQITQLQAEFPDIDLFLGQPLAATPELANSIVQRIK